jgi:hypothetical protein
MDRIMSLEVPPAGACTPFRERILGKTRARQGRESASWGMERPSGPHDPCWCVIRLARHFLRQYDLDQVRGVASQPFSAKGAPWRSSRYLRLYQNQPEFERRLGLCAEAAGTTGRALHTRRGQTYFFVFDSDFTTVVFDENRKIVGWGRNFFIEQVKRYAIKIKQE